MSEQFDFDKALAALQNGQYLTGKHGILTPLIKQLTEAALKAELESHLEVNEAPNRKNGSSRKTIKSSSGSFELDRHLFESITHAQDTATQWLWRYNNERPHMALGGITPAQKLAQAA